MMEKELAHDDPQFLPVQYNLTEKQLNQLAIDYDPALIPEAKEVGDEGYQQVHTKVMSIIKVRTNIDKVRKGLKEDSLKWGRKVDGEAKRLTQIVEDLEKPWRKVKMDLEEAERLKAEAELKAEQDRMKAIEEAIAAIRALAEGLINADSATIQLRIDAIKAAVVTEDKYGEYVEAAKVTGDIVLKSLETALEERTQFEQDEAELKEQREKFELEKAALKKEQKKVFDEKMAIRASEDAAKAAEEAEAQRKQDVKDALQRKTDKAQAALKDKAYLKGRLPQDKAVRAYADRLAKANAPMPSSKVPDEQLAALVEAAHMAVNAAITILRDNTQEEADDVDSD